MDNKIPTIKYVASITVALGLVVAGSQINLTEDSITIEEGVGSLATITKVSDEVFYIEFIYRGGREVSIVEIKDQINSIQSKIDYLDPSVTAPLIAEKEKYELWLDSAYKVGINKSK